MMGWGSLGSFGWLGMLLNLIISVGVVVGIVWLVVWLVRRTDSGYSKTSGQASYEQSPREILQVRYARGEITREQYEIMKKDISE